MHSVPECGHNRTLRAAFGSVEAHSIRCLSTKSDTARHSTSGSAGDGARWLGSHDLRQSCSCLVYRPGHTSLERSIATESSIDVIRGIESPINIYRDQMAALYQLVQWRLRMQHASAVRRLWSETYSTRNCAKGVKVLQLEIDIQVEGYTCPKVRQAVPSL